MIVDAFRRWKQDRRLARAGFRRMFLHAHTLRFAHPAEPQRLLDLQAPLPAEFDAILEAGRAPL